MWLRALSAECGQLGVLDARVNVIGVKKPLGRNGRAVAVLAIALSCAASCALAGAPSAEVDQCLASAAQKYRLSFPLLRAMAEQESGFDPGARGRPNADGSVDHGLLQINDSWLPKLARFDIRLQDLYRPCVNAEVGAWILAENIQRLGLTWNAIGAYNAKSTDKRQIYANAIYRRLQRHLKQPDRPIEARHAVQEPIVTAAQEPSTQGAMGVWEGGLR